MKSLLLWVSGAALAFFVTAAAFLALAEFGSSLSERRLPPEVEKPGPSLSMNLGETQLGKLKDEPDQQFVLGFRNRGEKKLSNISVTIKVSSEDTSLAGSRYYMRTLKSLPPGKYATVGLRLDLSPFRRPATGKTNAYVGNPETTRQIMEIRATTPDGASAVRTVILPPPSRNAPP